jgi:hypothetical protein
VFSPEYLYFVSTVALNASYVENIRDVEKSVFILVLFVYRAHQGRRGWQDLVHEDEDGFLGRKLDPLTDHVDELAYREIRRDEILLLVDRRDIRLLDFLADDLDAVSMT